MKTEHIKDYESFTAFKQELKVNIRKREEGFKDRLHKLDDFVSEGKRIGESVLNPVRALPIGGIVKTAGLLGGLFLSRKLKKRIALTLGIVQAVRLTPGIVKGVISVVKTLKEKNKDEQGAETLKSRRDPFGDHLVPSEEL